MRRGLTIDASPVPPTRRGSRDIADTAVARPPLPERDEEGNVPALEFVRATIARDILRERKALGLTQGQLAKLAGVRQETLCRLETGRHSPTVRTVEKIDRALKRMGGTKRRSLGPREVRRR
jgi:DNA-binding XRE family transcriptional regulator